GIDDVRIAGAATQVAAHPLTNLRVRQILDAGWAPDIGRGAARPARFHLFDHGDGPHDLAGCTETALEAIVLDERRLHRVEIAVPFQPFDRGDAFAVLHRRQGHAGENAAPGDVDGAGSALAAIACLLRTGQAELLTQRIEQCRARFDGHCPNPVVDRHADGHTPVVRHRVLTRLTYDRR